MINPVATIAGVRRAAAIASLAAVGIAGCFQSFSAPGLEDAPPEVQQRAELPSCGRVVHGYVGVASDDGAAECFWDAYLNRRPAEYQWFFYSDAGPYTWIHRIEEDGRIVVYGLDPGGWVRLECESLTSTAGDDTLFGPGFLTNDCAETRLGW